MVAYIEGVLLPSYVDQVRSMLDVGEDQVALVIFDHFKGHVVDTKDHTDSKREQHSICAGASQLHRSVATIGCFCKQICKQFLKAKISKLVCQ